jgi:hypothetical protein
MAHSNINQEANEYLVTTDVVTAGTGWRVEVDGVSYTINDVQVDTPIAGQTTIYAPGATFGTYAIYNVFAPDYTHQWNFDSDGKLYGPGEDGALELGGELVTDNMNLSIKSNQQSVVLNGQLGEFLGSSDDVNNQIATIGDVENAVNFAFGSFYSASDQTCTNGSIQAMQFPYEAATPNGVSVGGTYNTQLTLANYGTYNIQFSAQLQQTNASATVYIWLNRNGQPIANSNTIVNISANDPFNVAAWNWFVDANDGDYYEIMWRSDSNHTNLQYVSDLDIDITGVPGVPSVIVTVNQVG